MPPLVASAIRLHETAKQERLAALFGHLQTKQADVLDYGSMFSGWESPAMGLESMSIPHRHVFAVDSCAASRKVIKTNVKIQSGQVYGKVQTIKIASLPKANLFWWSPSCKAYSPGGNRDGKLAKNQDGVLARFGVKYVRQQEPDAFIMEQVWTMKRDFPKEWQSVVRALTQSHKEI